MWNYRARVVRVVDGDTLDVEVDLGFRVCTKIRLRLADVDTPEIYGVKKGSAEYEKGAAASQFTKDWVEENQDDGHVFIETQKGTGKYGRWLAVVSPGTGEGPTLNDALIASGHASEV